MSGLTFLKRWLEGRRALLFVLLLGLTLRLILLADLSGKPERFISTDSKEYINLAANMIDHGIYSISTEAPYKPATLRVPFYPTVILVFHNLLHLPFEFILLLQIAANIATALLLYSIVSRYFDNITALIAASILLLDGSNIINSNWLLTESFFTLIFLSGIYFIVRFSETHKTKSLFIAALLLGISCYIRVISVPYILFAILILLLLRNMKFKHKAVNAAFALVIFIAVISPWVIRNYTIYGLPAFSTGSNANLRFCRSAEIESKITGKSIDETKEEYILKTGAVFGENRPEYIYRPCNGTINSYNFREAIRVISAHPLIFAEVEIEGILKLLLSPGIGNFTRIMGYEHYELTDIQQTLNSDSKLNLSASEKWYTGAFFLYQLIFLGVVFGGMLIGLFECAYSKRFSNVVIVFGITLLGAPFHFIVFFIGTNFFLPMAEETAIP